MKYILINYVEIFFLLLIFSPVCLAETDIDDELPVQDYTKSKVKLKTSYLDGEMILYEYKGTNDDYLSFIKSENEDYFIISDSNPADKKVPWYEIVGKVDKPDRIRYGFLKGGIFYGVVKCYVDCRDNFFSQSKQEKLTRNLIWRNESNNMYLSSDKYEDIIFELQTKGINYKVRINRAIAKIDQNKVKIYAHQKGKSDGYKIIIDVKKRVITQLATYSASYESDVNYSKLLKNTEADMNIIYPIIVDGAILSNLPPEAVDIVSAVIDNIDNYYNTLRNSAKNEESLLIEYASIFKKYQIMSVGVDKDIENKINIAIQKKKDEYEIRFKEQANALRDVYIGKRVLIRNAADNLNGIASQKKMKHYKSCDEISYPYLQYVYISNKGSEKKIITTGRVLLSDRGFDDLAYTLMMTNYDLPKKYSLSSLSHTSEIDTYYRVENDRYERIWIKQFNHKTLGDHSFKIEAKTEYKIEQSTVFKDIDFLLNYKVLGLFSYDAEKDSSSKRKRIFDNIEKSLPDGLTYGSCPTDEFMRIIEKQEKISIDQATLKAGIKFAKSKLEGNRRRQVEREKSFQETQARCMRIQRTAWNTYSGSADAWFSYISTPAYQSQIKPFVLQNCSSITLPPGGK